ncbi:MAG TPA: YkgJ family cysteine cluster protein [Candidatus Limnocylindrales bacterium]|nr:YkgJ family cysteine cluster protein [Candidatus Limnocylindrales bacterium]
MEFAYPVNLRFKCNRCGLCCGDTKQKTRRILLLETEAEKIASQTCRPTTDFSGKISDNEPYVYEMKKSGEGKCVFLKDNQCSIYPSRPLICRCYPFELKFDVDKEMYSFDFTVECPGINQGKFLRKIDFERLFELAKKRLR